MVGLKQSSPPFTSRQSSDYLTIGQASKMFSLHPNTLRFYCDNGLIDFITTLGGHRRLVKISLEKKLGLVSEDVQRGTKKAAIYFRVSSHQQKLDGVLARQREKLLAYVKETYGEDAPLEFHDTASSFGRRRGFENMIFAMINQEVATVVSVDPSRTSRVPSTTSLLESIAEKYGVELVTIEKEGNQEEINLLVSELANYCQILCARMNARKGAKVLQFSIPDAGKTLALSEYAKGTSIARIRTILFEKNIRNPRNGKRISHGKISDFISASLPDRVKEKTSGVSIVERFLQQPFVILNANATIPSSVLFSRFNKWCESEEIAPLGKIHFCMELQRNGLERFRGHLRSWRGIGLAETA